MDVMNRRLAIMTPLGKDVFRLRAFSGAEMSSHLWHYNLDLVSENDSIKFQDIVGKNVTLRIYDAEGRSATGTASSAASRRARRIGGSLLIARKWCRGSGS